jgi:hypothetical protein
MKAAKTFVTQTKETQNEQLQPNQHPQQHRRSALHDRFFGNLPRRRARPCTNRNVIGQLHHRCINAFIRRLEMNSYNPNSLRSNVAATLCTILFSATLLGGTLAPAQAVALAPISAPAK